MTDNSSPPWNRLAQAAADAAKRGQTQLAGELAGAARQAWLQHCEAVAAEERARGRLPPRSVWMRDEERER